MNLRRVSQFTDMKGGKNAKILCMIAFLDLLAVSMVVPLMGRHLQTLGMSQFVIGLMTSLYSSLQLIFGPLIGSWSDIKGRRAIFIQTMGVCSVCYLLLGSCTSLFILVLLRIILGIFKHTQSICKALVADSVPNSLQSDTYGKLIAVAGIGFMVGPVIGGHLSELEDGFFYICCIGALTFWINIGFVYLLVPESTTQFQDSRLQKGDLIKGSDGKPWWKHLTQVFILLRSIEWSQYWDVFLLKFIIGFSQFIFFFNYGMYIQETFDLSSKWVGYTISFQGLVGAVSGLSLDLVDKFYKNDTTYNMRTFHGFLLNAISFCILGTASKLSIFILGLVPLSMSSTVLRVTGMEAVLQKTDADKRGSLMGSSNSISSIARLVAPLCGGLVHDLAGYRGIFLLTQVSSGLGAILAYYIWHQETKMHKKQ